MNLPPTDFTIVLEPSDSIAFGVTDTDGSPKTPQHAGEIVYFTAEVTDPAFTAGATTHPDAYLPHIGVRLLVAEEPIAGTGRDDFMPLRSLIGDRGAPIPYRIPVSKDTTIRAEFKSFDSAATPDLDVRLVAHCVRNRRAGA